MTKIDKIINYINENPGVSDDTIFCAFMTCDSQDIEEARAYTDTDPTETIMDCIGFNK